MFEMPDYRNPISLIPGGSPQLLDYEAPVSILADIKYFFAEIPDHSSQLHLHAYQKNEAGDIVDEMNPLSIYNDDGYRKTGEDAILPWLDSWLPVPFLRMREQLWPDSKECRFEYGPSNWSRARLTRDMHNPEILRLTLAFDMQTEEKQEGIYAALSPDDVDANAHFQLAWRYRDNAWFMDQAWVDEWLRGLWSEWQFKMKRRPREDDPQLAHLASYLVYLDALWRISRHCEVYAIRPDNRNCVNVDLVLDIGNSRTTGMLVETHVQSTTRLQDSYLLQLRDMSHPERVYTDPFQTCVEFAEIVFGNDALSMRSGRQTPAFVWPSPVRIGPEAAELATLSRCEKGQTGMSSPKRYLWDERDCMKTWRYNTQSEKAPYVTRGALAQLVNSSGTPICCMDDPRFKRNKRLRNQERDSAFESLFTRSSMMMFLFVEIIQQALLTINSPGQRLRRNMSDNPRRLRQIIFTVPAGMPMAEQKIYKRWVQWAVHVLWEALGWEQYYNGGRRTSPGGCDYRTSPVVRCDWDEATCTQLVFIYNEIITKYQGDAELFCKMTGHNRNFQDHVNSPSVRVAAMDIGGGTTDLSITTFELSSPPGSTPRLSPHPDFHDGFNIGGDDILRTVVEEHILPAIGDALTNAGIIGINNALAELFGQDKINSSKISSNQRSQFVRQIAAPVALCLLSLYEQADTHKDVLISFKFGDCFLLDHVTAGEAGEEQPSTKVGKYPEPGAGAMAYVRNYVAARTPINDFNIMDVTISVKFSAVDKTIHKSLKDILRNLCEVINLMDCDVLLLSGRPSRWPGVTNAIYSLLPMPPGRIFPMSEYRVGGWYPFADALGRITDPKTTVVVGAILCALAEGQMEGFAFDPHSLKILSTARYIGQMMTNGQIRKDMVWFEVDPEQGALLTPDVRDITFSGPLSVGFRQFDVERWTTTRFYYLDWVSPQALEKNYANLPLKVQMKYIMPEEEEEKAESDEGEFEILSVTDRNGEEPSPNPLDMRLQTLPGNEFWLDSGVIMDS